ncbi:MAG TPA: hypothetical protein DDW42_06000 [Desulfobacteraceae bacterium]|nr:hypothetical protein [Desulfobacteraceae bacterium]
MENRIKVDLSVEYKSLFSELMDRVNRELEGKYNKDKDILKLNKFSREGDQIHLVYEVIKGGAVRPKKEFSSPYKEMGGRMTVFG